MSTQFYGYHNVPTHTYGQREDNYDDDGYDNDELHSMHGPSTRTATPAIGRTNSFGSHYSRSSNDYNSRTQSPHSPGAFPLIETQNTMMNRPPSYQSQSSNEGRIGRYNDGYGRQHGSYIPSHGLAGVAPADLPVTTARGIGYQDSMYIEGNKEETKKCCNCKCCTCTCSKSCWKTATIWILITLFTIGFLLFIAVWVVFPLVFMNTYSLQRFFIFLDIEQPENPEYTNFDKYNVVGVRNFYVEINDLCCPNEETPKKIKLGTWQVVPKDEIERSRRYTENDYIQSLRNSKLPIIIYFHGQSGTRIFFYSTYNVLRQFFHVLAFDYRGYADSTDADITELNVVRDSIQFYQWVLNNTLQDNIYVWGHSLGTALSTHTLREIYRNDRQLLKPRGLILEAPFTTMREAVYYNPLAKYWRWLAYFEQTFQDPVEENGFIFQTVENIKHVDCPVMVVHAEDDIMIPYHLGKKVYEIAYNNRTNPGSNKKAIFKLVPTKIKSNHMAIYKDPQLPNYILEFLKMASSDTRSLNPQRIGL